MGQPEVLLVFSAVLNSEPRVNSEMKGKEMALEIAYHPQLYLGESIKRKKLDKIKKKLERSPRFSGVFLVALSRNAHDQLEIYHAKQLDWSYYVKYPPYVVGIAGDQKEAFSLVTTIVEECLTERGDCALKEYLRC